MKAELIIAGHLPKIIHIQRYGDFMLKTMTETDRDKAMMVCVDGIPYSASHLCSKRTTGGMVGLGQQMRSFIPYKSNDQF